MKNKNNLFNLFILIFLITGTGLMLYPAFSNWWNEQRQSAAVARYDASLENYSWNDYEEEYEKARQYNESLHDLDYPLNDFAQISGYEEALNVGGSSMMGTLTIPKISLSLPIYHSVDETVLNHAVGHLEGSSLPIGQTGSHAVLSAHRGLPSATLFTRLDEMELGDTFTLNILNEQYDYEVISVDIIEPWQSEYLNIEKDKDLVTLLTCTPYGINSHRLLVKGQRTEAKETNIPSMNSRSHMPWLWIVLAAAAAVCMIRRKRKTRAGKLK